MLNRIRFLLGWSAIGIVIGTPCLAMAGGFDYSDHGALALSRGSAFVARADDPTALYYNPAGIARLKGTHILFNGSLLQEDIRYQRWVFADGKRIDRYPNDQGVRMPEVANTNGAFPTPFVAITSDLGVLRPYNLVLMAGFYGPNSHGSRTFPRYCKPGVSPCVPTDSSGLPSPARYEKVSLDSLVIYPSLGLAWEVIKGLRIGGVFQLGYSTLGYSTVIAGFKNEDPFTDIDVRFEAKSSPTATGIVGLHWSPFAWLELGASLRFGLVFTVDGEICIGERDGDKCQFPEETTENLYKRFGFKVKPEPNPAEATLEIPMPWVVRTGARYIHRDNQERELFDVELDFVWESTSSLQDFMMKPKEPVQLFIGESGTVFSTVRDLPVIHGWEDSWSLRLGGSYNIHGLLGEAVLSFHGGGLYETPVIPEKYTRLDFVALERWGLTAGFGVRWRKYELNFGYAHLFHVQRLVAPPEGTPECGEGVSEPCGSAVHQIVPLIPGKDKSGGPIGNGVYRVAIDEWTLGLKAAF
ncbi:MAG: hypothetical protein V1754_00430 [Pseudomonadota bacterium]